MNKAFQDPELVRGFERLVQEFNHKKWSQVAKQLQVQYNVKVSNPSVLKPMWEKLNLNKEIFTPNDEKVLLDLFVKHRSIISHMTEEFNEITNKRYTKQRLYCQGVLLVRRTLLNLVVLFSQKKQYNKQIMSHISPKSVGKFLAVSDLKNLNEPFNKMIQESAQELIDLLKTYKHCMNDSRQKQYSKLRNIMCRWKFEKILYCMYYIDQIKQIFDKKYTEDEHLFMKDSNNQMILKHELLQPTLEDNRVCEIYERIFFEDNGHKFLDLYNVSKHENTSEYLYFIQPPKKKIEEGKLKEVHKKQKMTIRGRIRTDSEPLHRGWKTTIFQYQEEETNQDLKQKQTKLNDKF